jgi:hypothetical protein
MGCSIQTPGLTVEEATAAMHARFAYSFFCAGLALFVQTTATLATSFQDLAGTWRGVGRVQLLSGQSEALSCRAYFTAKEGGSGLGIALACASASNKIDLRAALAQTGEAISGSWEERSFNSTGSVAGTFSDDRIDLTIDGTIKATMSITLEGKSQLISIATEGQGFRSVDLELERS